jgi:osmotically-inducible protein OsmY
MKTDIELILDIQDGLGCEPAVRTADIGVTARDGVVTLTGRVSSKAEKQAAERAAYRVLQWNAATPRGAPAGSRG